jgi:hypothetical protein
MVNNGVRKILSAFIGNKQIKNKKIQIIIEIIIESMKLYYYGRLDHNGLILIDHDTKVITVSYSRYRYRSIKSSQE